MNTTPFSSAVSLSLPPSLTPEQVWDAYQSECASHEQRVQATAVVHDAMLATFEGMGVKELPLKGALFAMAATVPGVTEEIIKTCCDNNPATFTFLPAHGLRKATVSRVLPKSDKPASSMNDAAEKVEAVVKAITEEPHQGATYYKAKFGFNKEQWKTVIDLVLKSGAIDKSGERANTVYFPKAKAA